MPRSLFDDMTQQVQPVPVTPRAFGVAPLNETLRTAKPADPNAGKNFFQRTASQIGNIMSTPITPNANLQLAQVAAAIAPEGSWQSRLAQTVGGQVQNDINTQYLQDVLAGREPTTKEIRGVPLDVQMGARQQALGEQQQKFQQARQVEEFDVTTALQKVNQFIDMMNAQTQQKRADTDEERMLLEARQLEEQYGQGKRRQYADFGGVGIYNIETGEYEVDPNLLALRKRMAELSGGKDDIWQKVQSVKKDARAEAEKYLEKEGIYLIDEDTGRITGIKGSVNEAKQMYKNAYQQALTKEFGSERWQIPLQPQEIEALVTSELAQQFDADSYLGKTPGTSEEETDGTTTKKSEATSILRRGK